MKKIIAVAVCLFCVGSAHEVFAQGAAAPAAVKADAQQPEAGSQQSAVKTIFAYKNELKITDKQEKDLKKILTDLQNDFDRKRKKVTSLNSDLAKMINEKASLMMIRFKLYTIARLRADASFADIEASRKVESILTEDQRVNWKVIQEQNRKELIQKVNEAKAKQQQSGAGAENQK